MNQVTHYVDIFQFNDRTYLLIKGFLKIKFTSFEITTFKFNLKFKQSKIHFASKVINFGQILSICTDPSLA